MNNLASKSFHIGLALAATIFAFTGCTPKNEPRFVHEGQVEWKPAQAPIDESVDVQALEQYDLAGAEALLKQANANLVQALLKPLSRFVLNGKFVATPAHRTQRLSRAIGAFMDGFLRELERRNSSAEFKQLKTDFYATVFDGCAADLRRGCNVADYFSLQPQHSRIMTLLAMDLDAELQNHLDRAGSPGLCVGLDSLSDAKLYAGAGECRRLVDERYRRLSMAHYRKSNLYRDNDFDTAYVHYANLFALFVEFSRRQPGSDSKSMATSYLAETNPGLFKTILEKYEPRDKTDPAHRRFVRTFKPWTYSEREAHLFQISTQRMFAFAASCCLFDEKGNLDGEFLKAIALTQNQETVDSMGKSFHQMVLELRKQHDNRLFDRLKMGRVAELALNLNSSFYDEYFFIVDRLFRKHISAAGAEEILRHLDEKRTRERLPKMAENYVKIYLLYMVAETNRFMADVYHSDIGSDQILDVAQSTSRDLSDRWHGVQAQAGVINTLLGGYFKGLRLANDPSYVRVDRLLAGLSRNIHYVSVVPNMLATTYFTAIKNGTLADGVNGDIVEAPKAIRHLLDGQVLRPWFPFATSPEPVDQAMLLYSLEYLNTTGAIDAYKADAEKFYEILFNKYLDESEQQLSDAVNDVERATSEVVLAEVVPLCDYEDGKISVPPTQKIGFLQLKDYTYSGIGNQGPMRTLNTFLTTLREKFDKLRKEIDHRRTYARVMRSVLAKGLVERNIIQSEEDDHADLRHAHRIIRKFDDLENRLVRRFLSKHREYFKCARNLLTVEHRRTQLLYDLERQHLGEVFDAMEKEFAGVTDAKILNDRASVLSARLFTPEKGYRMDEIVGRTYRMSNYDLLMRMRRRLESDVISEGKSRFISVIMGDEVERDPIVSSRISAPIYNRGDREDFIRQGISRLGGESSSYLKWYENFRSDRTLIDYVTILANLYVMSPVGRDISAAELTDAYIEAMASLTLDASDQINYRDFGVQGRYNKDFYIYTSERNSEAHLALYDRDGQTRLPFFYGLMDEVTLRADVRFRGFGMVSKAYDLAKTYNSLSSFVFQPSSAVESSVKKVYGERVNWQLTRIQELYNHLRDRETMATDVGSLNPRLRLPYILEGGVAKYWYDSRGPKFIYDAQKGEDHRILIEDFARKTDFFYRDFVREKAKGQ